MVTESITNEVADKVAATITRSGKSKLSVAEQAGIPTTTFNRKINGHGDFSLRELDLVAKALGVDPATFLPLAFRQESRLTA
ncbi:helix-turn-helix domain-containing protein [Plantibacter sp. YIM 135249]|uniref:helix-turn-helix domain-containing protein n=1 Tax=Plantibacter sp. YIM 135249 TaxID=3423918 RepID=UPI003D344F45